MEKIKEIQEAIENKKKYGTDWIFKNVTSICRKCHVNIDGYKNPTGRNQWTN